MTKTPDRLLTLGVAVVVVASAVRLNTPGLGLGGLVTPARLCIQLTAVGMAGLLALRYPSHLFNVTTHAASKWLLAFCVFAVVSALWSVDPARTLTQGATALAIALTVLIHAQVNGWQVTRALLTRGFVVVLAFGTLVDLLTNAEEARWVGVSGAATQLAQLAVVTGLFALLGWIRRCETPQFTAAVMMLCLGEIVMSQSRVALATLTLAIVWAVWVRLPRVVRPSAALGLVAAVLTSSLVLINQVQALVLRDNAEASDLTEFTGRTSIWPEAIDTFTERPIAGFGFASGEVVWADRVLIGHLNWYPSNAHNLGLEVLLSLGVIGLFLLAGCYVSAIADRSHHGYYAAASILVVILILGATEAIVHFASPNLVALALASAIGATALREATSRTHLHPWRSRLGAV